MGYISNHGWCDLRNKKKNKETWNCPIFSNQPLVDLEFFFFQEVSFKVIFHDFGMLIPSMCSTDML